MVVSVLITVAAVVEVAAFLKYDNKLSPWLSFLSGTKKLISNEPRCGKSYHQDRLLFRCLVSVNVSYKET